MNRTYLLIGIGALGLIVIASWFIFFSGSSTPPTTAPNTTSGETRTTTVGTQAGTQTNVPSASGPTGSGTSGGIIFKIDNGPVAAATFMQTTRPTTTIARYVMQENAHVFDLAVDTPGAVARSVSNTTVPGITQAQWAAGGTTALLQDRKSTRLNSSHSSISYAVFCLKKIRNNKMFLSLSASTRHVPLIGSRTT